MYISIYKYIHTDEHEHEKNNNMNMKTNVNLDLNMNMNMNMNMNLNMICSVDSNKPRYEILPIDEVGSDRMADCLIIYT
jgi:hypothetical protein